MATVVLGLGSNLGDRLAALQSVIDAMPPRFRHIEVSRVFETPPWGPVAQESFCNAAVRAETDLTPEEVLAFAQECEQRLGRERDVRWGPRTLDVDVVSYGEEHIDTPSLTLPHPWAHERAFVLVCLVDIDPTAEIPGRGRADALLAQLDSAGIREVGELRVPA